MLLPLQSFPVHVPWKVPNSVVSVLLLFVYIYCTKKKNPNRCFKLSLGCKRRRGAQQVGVMLNSQIASMLQQGSG